MSVASRSSLPELKFAPDAYHFVFDALQYTQQQLNRPRDTGAEEEAEAHITGQELLGGIRELALKQFGLMSRTVFQNWGVRRTDDFGTIVFELVDRKKMRKTDQDSHSDFVDVYDFEDALDRDYTIDTSSAFSN